MPFATSLFLQFDSRGAVDLFFSPFPPRRAIRPNRNLLCRVGRGSPVEHPPHIMAGVQSGLKVQSLNKEAIFKKTVRQKFPKKCISKI